PSPAQPRRAARARPSRGGRPEPGPAEPGPSRARASDDRPLAAVDVSLSGDLGSVISPSSSS
ncbi:MAG: hypothetical protein AB1673_11000, partial [Actinomycetota bacterium]